MDAPTSVSSGPLIPSLSSYSSSGFFPIRAPLTLDDEDDSDSDLDSNFPKINDVNGSSSYSGASSYDGFESQVGLLHGEDVEIASQKKPILADSDEEKVEDGAGWNENPFFRPLVVDHDDEIEGENEDADKDWFFRPFVAYRDDEFVEDDGGVDENRLFGILVAGSEEDKLENGSERERYTADDIGNGSALGTTAVGNVDSNLDISMPIARLSMEFDDGAELGFTEEFEYEDFVSTVRIPCFAPMEGEEQVLTETTMMAAGEEVGEVNGSLLGMQSCGVTVNQLKKVLAMDSREQPAVNEAVETPVSAEVMSENTGFDTTDESLQRISECGGSIEALELDDVSIDRNRSNEREFALRLKSLGLFDTEYCSIQPCEVVTLVRNMISEVLVERKVEAITDEHLAMINFDVAESVEYTDPKNQTNELIGSEAGEEAEFIESELLKDALFDSLNFLNSMGLNPNSDDILISEGTTATLNDLKGPMTENIVFEIESSEKVDPIIDGVENEHEDDKEMEPFLRVGLSEEERRDLEKVALLKVKFLRFVYNLGCSPEDPIAAHVLHLLNLAINQSHSRSALDKTAAGLEAVEEGIDSLNILVLGKSGVGKSATINSIFREQKLSVDAFEPATRTVKVIVGTLSNGIKIRILDTPGLRSCVTEQSYNRKILVSVKKIAKKFPIDTVLYLDRLDSHTDEYGDLPLLQTITNSLGASVWRNTIVTLTHASSPPPDGPEGFHLNHEEFVRQRSSMICRCIAHVAGGACVLNPDLGIHPVSLIENHHPGEAGAQQLLLLCCSMKTLNEADSFLKDFKHGRLKDLSYSMKCGGDSALWVDVLSRLTIGRRNRFDILFGLETGKTTWKITLGAVATGNRPIQLLGLLPMAFSAFAKFFLVVNQSRT